MQYLLDVRNKLDNLTNNQNPKLNVDNIPWDLLSNIIYQGYTIYQNLSGILLDYYIVFKIIFNNF